MISNNLLAVLVVMAVFTSISGTVMMLYAVPPRQAGPITGMAQSTAVGIANVSLPAEANIELVVPIVDFGNILATPGTEETTMYFEPAPFRLKNNGSAVINVSIAEANATGQGLLWDRDDNGTYFEYNCTQVVPTTTAIWYASWTPFNDSYEAGSFIVETLNLDAAPKANLVYNLSQGNSYNEVFIHLNVTVPASEPFAVKQATILFNAELG